MINFIPIFPLNIVVFPGESLHLHIFEPNYIQLVNDCIEQHKPFGIPTVLNNSLKDMGTLVKVSALVKTYEDGKMDIKTQGIQLFKILEIVKDVPDKLYNGAIVSYPNYSQTLLTKKMASIFKDIKQLHTSLNIFKDFKKKTTELSSYDVAHHIGLNIEQEYELLQLLTEEQRLEYIKNHLQKVIPMLSGIESLKHKIQLNGHFKELKGFNL